jgi:hypothetical protein
MYLIEQPFMTWPPLETKNDRLCQRYTHGRAGTAQDKIKA